MDKAFEENICRIFFDKRASDRLAYELGSAKKRRSFLNKLSHTSEDYLAQNAIQKRFERPPEPAQITEYLKSSICYVISFSETDGIFSELSEALDTLYLNGMAYMLISPDGKKAYLEAENDFIGHRAYFLKQ